MSTLTCSVVSQQFPAGTVKEEFVFAIMGTHPDGTPYTDSVKSSTPSVFYTFPPGTFTVAISKNGVSSLPSDPATFTAPTPVTFEVPDPSGKAVING